jgi:hypothetical protein
MLLRRRTSDQSSIEGDSIALRLEGSVQTALNGDGAELGDVLASDCRWDGESETASGATAMAARLGSIGKFFETPRFAIDRCVRTREPLKFAPSRSEAWAAEWAFSGSWPLPWRPRITVRGTCRIATIDGSVVSVEDKWSSPSNVVDLILSQVCGGDERAGRGASIRPPLWTHRESGSTS